ncbi:uncharacterized protein LOC9661246 [Selaginella moellendorffii]|uniref:uncharacterized protein LOC9661246 n=1 Tax=Selaginella moellendorffii TaxID=88036 RepID=UPI000D1C70D4|nr:uncharacterized protein LOC9661246 [Selaginella moellendorffii]|eukprot:XP_002988835.2 uncharacterized protein LOC9661246 [Selaginella moellendorffii]
METPQAGGAGHGDDAWRGSSCDPALPLESDPKRQQQQQGEEAWNCAGGEGDDERPRKKLLLHDPAAAGALSSWSPNPGLAGAGLANASAGGDGGGWMPSAADKMEYSMEADNGKNNIPQLVLEEERKEMKKEEMAMAARKEGAPPFVPPALVPPSLPSRGNFEQPIKEEAGSEEAEERPKIIAATEDDKRKARDPHHHHHHKRDRDGNAKVEEEKHEDVKMEAGGGDDAIANSTGIKGKDRSVENNAATEDEIMEDAAQPVDKDKIVQQRKRMSRQRGEGRSRFRSKDREGWLGARAESSAVTYKIGEGLPELAKLWKESASSSSEGGSNGGAAPLLEVRVAADLATTSNRQVRGSQLWGTDIYTEDSDLVAVLMHTGYYSPTASPPPSCISEIRATLRVLPPQNGYKSTLRNSVRSRAWGAASGCSYSIERCRIVKSGGGFADLEPCLNRMPVVAPTLAPAAMERTMTTRSASSNAHRQQRFVQEVTIQYNLCNEPWLKYSMSIVADRGLKKSLYTSARLKKGDVLYLETHSHRYELSYDGEKASSNGTAPATTTATSSQAPSQAPEKPSKDKAPSSDKEKPHSHNGFCDKNGDYAEHYKWARCNVPLPLSIVRSKGVPLPPDCVQVLEESLTWEEVQWSPTSVWVRGKEFPLARAQFLSPGVSP